MQKTCLQARLFCYTVLYDILIQCYTVLDAISMQCLKLCLLVKPVIKDFIIMYSFFQIGNGIPFSFCNTNVLNVISITKSAEGLY